MALDLTLCVADGAEDAAARQCLSQMRPTEWESLCRLAAAVVSLQEEVSTGQCYLVAPVSTEHYQAVVRRMQSRR